MNREMLARGIGALILLAGAVVTLAGIWAYFETDVWDYLIYSGGGVLAMFVGRSMYFPGVPEAVPVDPDDPLLQEAQEQAHRELHRFVAGLADGKREPLVKYSLQMKGGEREQVWGIAHSLHESYALVTLMTVPFGKVDVEGARQQLPINDIEDWVLIDADGRMEGGFSEIAMARIHGRDEGFIPYAIKKRLALFDYPPVDDLL